LVRFNVPVRLREKCSKNNSGGYSRPLDCLVYFGRKFTFKCFLLKDACDDVVGAINAGMQGIQVKTG